MAIVAPALGSPVSIGSHPTTTADPQRTAVPGVNLHPCRPACYEGSAESSPIRVSNSVSRHDSYVVIARAERVQHEVLGLDPSCEFAGNQAEEVLELLRTPPS